MNGFIFLTLIHVSLCIRYVTMDFAVLNTVCFFFPPPPPPPPNHQGPLFFFKKNSFLSFPSVVLAHLLARIYCTDSETSNNSRITFPDQTHWADAILAKRSHARILPQNDL